MLGKLIKHEFKATRKGFSVLFAAMLLVTLLIKPLFWIQKGMIADDVPFSVSEFAVIWFFFMVMGLFLSAGMVLSIIRYYQSLACDEAYLTFTLPVTAGQLIWAKALTGFVWNLACSILMVCCTVLVFAGTPFMRFAWPVLVEDIAVQSDFSIGPVPVFCVLYVLALFSNMLYIICIIGIGQLFGKYRPLATICSYFGLNMLISFLFLLLAIPTGVISFGYTVGENEVILNEAEMGMGGIIITVLYGLLIGIGAFLGARYLFKKKLNLE